MIFVQKPYDVGDRIAIGDVTGVAGREGQAGWIVERVNLYSTTIRLGATREVATVPNGQLACTRITNLKRSKKAFVYIHLKFGIGVSNDKAGIVRSQVKEFVDSRPREWVTMSGFRMTEIQADLG
jgi:small-conductance mechanosensitive channel